MPISKKLLHQGLQAYIAIENILNLQSQTLNTLKIYTTYDFFKTRHRQNKKLCAH